MNPFDRLRRLGPENATQEREPVQRANPVIVSAVGTARETAIFVGALKNTRGSASSGADLVCGIALTAPTTTQERHLVEQAAGNRILSFGGPRVLTTTPSIAAGEIRKRVQTTLATHPIVIHILDVREHAQLSQETVAGFQEAFPDAQHIAIVPVPASFIGKREFDKNFKSTPLGVPVIRIDRETLRERDRTKYGKEPELIDPRMPRHEDAFFFGLAGLLANSANFQSTGEERPDQLLHALTTRQTELGASVVLKDLPLIMSFGGTLKTIALNDFSQRIAYAIVDSFAQDRVVSSMQDRSDRSPMVTIVQVPLDPAHPQWATLAAEVRADLADIVKFPVNKLKGIILPPKNVLLVGYSKMPQKTEDTAPVAVVNIFRQKAQKGK